MFERLTVEQPDFRSKIQVVKGDILEPNFALSSEDEQTLVEDVSIVFHCAATVKFDEALKYVGVMYSIRYFYFCNCS